MNASCACDVCVDRVVRVWSRRREDGARDARLHVSSELEEHGFDPAALVDGATGGGDVGFDATLFDVEFGDGLLDVGGERGVEGGELLVEARGVGDGGAFVRVEFVVRDAEGGLVVCGQVVDF